ncbi:MAG: hypothetical protein HYS14_11740 [Candidatus Rokubacteria bacterium]|nr:hypothetical protein [Candidatus Rokubacteria bacterium]
MAGAAEALRALQVEQRQHDLRAHEDIVHLPYPDRMRHLTFHVAKYAGRLARREPEAGETERTVVDAFIVGLSAGDVLRLNFAEELGGHVLLGEHGDLAALGRGLNAGRIGRNTVVEWYFRELADVAGRMAKACESLDHMEAVPYRQMLSTAVIQLCRATLVAASLLMIDLESVVRARWQAIESESVL